MSISRARISGGREAKTLYNFMFIRQKGRGPITRQRAYDSLEPRNQTAPDVARFGWRSVDVVIRWANVPLNTQVSYRKSRLFLYS
jgi:hypothetical protein